MRVKGLVVGACAFGNWAAVFLSSRCRRVGNTEYRWCTHKASLYVPVRAGEGSIFNIDVCGRGRWGAKGSIWLMY